MTEWGFGNVFIEKESNSLMVFLMKMLSELIIFCATLPKSKAFIINVQLVKFVELVRYG